MTVHGPTDPELARLWSVAVAKFETVEGRPPGSPAEWRVVMADYDRLLSKPRGTLAAVLERMIQEQCPDVADTD